MKNSPGTVSKILWHFTGGPKWDAENRKQFKELKPSDHAFKALCQIIKTKELITGAYKETVKFVTENKIHSLNEVNPVVKNSVSLFESSPVCCLADIPIQHLTYHSRRYGKMAIGFHRNAVVRGGFNPVLYALEHSFLAKTLREGHHSAIWSNTSTIISVLEKIKNCKKSDNKDIDLDFDSIPIVLGALRRDYESTGYLCENDHKSSVSSFENILAYVKTFSLKEFDSIYCEREWRKTSKFTFKEKDIAMIVLPRKQDNRDYYNEFLKTIDLPRAIPVLCWEDLIEH
jgi:hypothetical protein